MTNILALRAALTVFLGCENSAPYVSKLVDIV